MPTGWWCRSATSAGSESPPEQEFDASSQRQRSFHVKRRARDPDVATSRQRRGRWGVCIGRDPDTAGVIGRRSTPAPNHPGGISTVRRAGGHLHMKGCRRPSGGVADYRLPEGAGKTAKSQAPTHELEHYGQDTLRRLTAHTHGGAPVVIAARPRPVETAAAGRGAHREHLHTGPHCGSPNSGHRRKAPTDATDLVWVHSVTRALVGSAWGAGDAQTHSEARCELS